MRQTVPITFRPITQWPGAATRSRTHSQFTAKWPQTLDLLDRELFHVRARNVVIQLDCDERDVRRDGIPRADARVRGPGVILSFDSPKGSLSFPCDRFTDWQDNVRAIALGLEALRAVDRYGVTRSAEQYRGWTALPDKSAEAVDWLKKELGMNWNCALTDGVKNAIRQVAITRLHPDRQNGDDSKWKLWQVAAQSLGIEV